MTNHYPLSTIHYPLFSDAVVIALIAGAVLDLLVGDPPWLPHPVRLIGRLALWSEPRCRALLRNEYLAGAIFALGLVALSGGAVALLVWGLGQIHPVLASIAMVYFMYAGLAMRDLAREAGAVWQALQSDNLATARQRLSRIVGRDTEQLGTPEIVRGAVETVAESTVDGILAPLFFAALGGVLLLWAYKAINTLDSTVGHREEPYTRFGWMAARMDDVANFIPARLALLFFATGALVAGGQAGRCWHVGRRDGHKHPSPNAGISEAAMAGALGVRLGGKNTYDGVEEVRPYVGDPVHSLEPSCIPQAIRIMYATSLLALLVFAAARWWVMGG